jgi:hypothetical protein
LLLVCPAPAGAEALHGPLVRQADVAAVARTDTTSEPRESAQTPEEQPSAQAADEKKPPTPPHTGVRALTSGLVEDVKHLPSKPNAYLTMLGGGLALAVHPIDDNVNARLAGSENVWRPGKYVGLTPVQMGTAAAVFAVGRIQHQPKVSHLGMDLLRAQILTSGLTVGLKYATQRERPDQSSSHSFPSGHASITFATATVIERHLGWRYSVLGYTIASYVAASRLHDNRHWLSDVVFGSAVGAIGGRTVTQHGRNTWTMTPVPVPGGVALVAAKTGG